MRRVLGWLPTVAGCYALIGGAVTILGWALDIPRLADWNGGRITMQPNAALAALLAGVALLLRPSRWRHTLGVCVLLLGAATLFEHLTGIDLAIDRFLLFDRPWGQVATLMPGRMGVPAATSWTLAGIAVILMRRQAPVPTAVPAIGLTISCIAALSVIGYLLGVDNLYALPRLTAIAFQTGTILLSVGIGLVATAPNIQPVRILMGDSAGGALARRALPGVILLPVILGLLCLRGHLSGLYDAPMAVALLVLSLTIILCAVLWWGVSAVVLREESLLNSEKRFSRFMEQLPGLAWIKDDEGRYLYVNEAAERVFGMSRDRLLGQTDDEIFCPETAAQFHKNDSEALRSSEGVQVVETLKHDDGVIHHSIVSKFPIAGPHDETTMIGGIAIDITDRRRAEETVTALLRISKQLNSTLSLDGLLDILAQESIALVGAEAGVSGLLTSQGMVCTKYFKQGEILPLEYCWPPMHGLPGWLIVHKTPYLTNDAKSDKQIVPELREQFGVRTAISTPIITAQGEVIGFFEIHNKRDGSGFTSSDQELLLAVSRAAAVAVQNALAYRSLQEAEKSLKLADRRKDEFLAVLAHELRNPLAPIRNALEIFKRSNGDQAVFGIALNAMDRQVTHMVRLVDDLLDLSRISHDKLELRKQHVDLMAIISQAIETSRPLADREQQTITLVRPSDQIELEADSIRLAQVFSNLLNNACKFSSPGREIVISAARDGSDAVVTVQDHGLGISPENLEQVFEMFTQLEPSSDRPYGGLGIGLSLARRLVEMHGGTITAHSQGIGQGSQFAVRLPVSPERSVPESTTVPMESATPASNRILVVDDNIDSATTLGMLVRLNGHDAVLAHDGVQACELAESFRPDVILLDIGLPKMSGHEVCRAIRKNDWGQRITIIALTGWGKEEDRRLSQEAGFDGHLVKPIDHETLMEMLSRTLPMPTQR